MGVSSQSARRYEITRGRVHAGEKLQEG